MGGMGDSSGSEDGCRGIRAADLKAGANLREGHGAGYGEGQNSTTANTPRGNQQLRLRIMFGLLSQLYAPNLRSLRWFTRSVTKTETSCPRSPGVD
jgi:hypothetical protein